MPETRLEKARGTLPEGYQFPTPTPVAEGVSIRFIRQWKPNSCQHRHLTVTTTPFRGYTCRECGEWTPKSVSVLG